MIDFSFLAMYVYFNVKNKNENVVVFTCMHLKVKVKRKRDLKLNKKMHFLLKINFLFIKRGEPYKAILRALGRAHDFFVLKNNKLL